MAVPEGEQEPGMLNVLYVLAPANGCRKTAKHRIVRVCRMDIIVSLYNVVYGSAKAIGNAKLAAVTVSDAGNEPPLRVPAVPKRFMVGLLFIISSKALLVGPPMPIAAQVASVAAKAKK